MVNFGYTNLRLVAPYDMAFREARSAVGASEILQSAEVYHTLAEAVADCHKVIGTTAGTSRSLTSEPQVLPDAGRQINQALQAGKLAILFGSEKHGLANEDLSYCHSLLQIPTKPEQPSLNLAQAVMLVLYELERAQAGSTLSKDTPRPEAAKDQRADMQTVHRLTETLLEASRLSGYLKDTESRPSASSASEEKLRRLVLRMQLSQTDADTWTGMFRQMLWKMGQP
jgi:TrmH family RNA methyltransferase